MKISRLFTDPDRSPYATIEFRTVASEIRNPDGSVVFRQESVEVPAAWSQVACDVLAQKYLRKAGIPAHLQPVKERGVPAWLWRHQGDAAALAALPAAERFRGETSAREVFDRLAGTWTYWGWKSGYFDEETDARAFFDELRYMLATQRAAPNSPQWFNTGLHWAYGIDGPAQGHYFADPRTGDVAASKSAYERPQPHACFIQSIDDDLVNAGGIMDLWVREARLFKYGSGSGTNFSRLRGENEPLSGGGRSSGLMSFLKIGDRAAGAIKSGGTTRRAAKMVVVDIDHPDIEAFITWKLREEQKVAALVAGSRAARKHLQEIVDACFAFDAIHDDAVHANDEARFDPAAQPRASQGGAGGETGDAARGDDPEGARTRPPGASGCRLSGFRYRLGVRGVSHGFGSERQQQRADLQCLPRLPRRRWRLGLTPPHRQAPSPAAWPPHGCGTTSRMRLGAAPIRACSTTRRSMNGTPARRAAGSMRRTLVPNTCSSTIPPAISPL